MQNLSFDNIKGAVVRVDFNVPIDSKGAITNTARIDGMIPTLKSILSQGGKLVLMSHLGRPKHALRAVSHGADSDKSLRLIVDTLAAKLDSPVHFVEDCGDASLQSSCLDADPEVLLENLRFYP